MSVPSSMSIFHQWLLAAPSRQASGSALLLHCDDPHSCNDLIQDIADYLNEYDDDDSGRWLPATPDLVEKIARTPNHRDWLGMPDAALPDPFAECHQTLAGLSQRGHVVCRAPEHPDPTLQFAKNFHAGVGYGDFPANKCHLILNSELLDKKCIAHIIGDVFLEWLHCDVRQSTPLHEIR